MGTDTTPTAWSVKHLQLAVHAARVALWRWNVDSDDFYMDERGFSLWELEWSERLEFEHLSEHIHPADRDRVRAAFIATRSVAEPFEIDFRIKFNDVVKWISARGQGGDEEMIDGEMFGIFIDVTGRKQAEEGHELLAGEMSHRVKNLLSIATGLTAITSRSSGSVEAMTQDLTRRLTALGRAHDLVRPLPAAQGNAALLGDMISVLLAPYDDLGAFNGRVRVAVPRMGIGEHGTNTLAMVVHELATNSVKHGALSCDHGMLEVTGVVEDDRLALTWSENGGPDVDEVPTLSGFGSKMISGLVEAELDGSISYDWQPTGLVATVSARLDLLAK